MRIDDSVTFTARDLDAETGLLYFRNRYQHPHLGRFVTRDPIGYGDVIVSPTLDGIMRAIK